MIIPPSQIIFEDIGLFANGSDKSAMITSQFDAKKRTFLDAVHIRENYDKL